MLSLLLGACATAAPQPVTPVEEVQPEPVAKTAPVAQVRHDPIVYRRHGFTITLPFAFTTLETDDPNDLLARSDDKLGDKQVVVKVTSLELDHEDPSAEDFGQAVVMHTMQTEDDMRFAKQITIDGLPGAVCGYVSENIVVLQEAVGYTDVGFIVQCGGDGNVGPEVAHVCMNILETLTINK